MQTLSFLQPDDVSPAAPARRAQPFAFAMPHDLDLYRDELAALGIPEAMRDALLESLWRLAGHFADQAFGIDPTQLAAPQPPQDRADGTAGDRGE